MAQTAFAGTPGQEEERGAKSEDTQEEEEERRAHARARLQPAQSLLAPVRLRSSSSRGRVSSGPRAVRAMSASQRRSFATRFTSAASTASTRRSSSLVGMRRPYTS